MKIKFSPLLIVALMACLLIGFFVIYEWQQPRVLAEVVWEAPHNHPKPSLIASWLRVFLQRPRQVDTFALMASSALPDFSSERVRNPDGTDALKITWKGTTALGGPTLADFTFVKGLTPGAHYAVTGAIRRENMDSTCRVEMTSLIYVGTKIKEGHNANETYYEAARNTDWQPFALPVDESKMDFSMAGFLVNLQLNGPNTVELRNLKFIRYSSGTNPLNLNPSFIEVGQLGILVSVGLAIPLALGGIIFLITLQRRRREREMRRIASMDG